MASEKQWRYFEAVTRPALDAASPNYLNDIRVRLDRDGLPEAVAYRDTPRIYNWPVGVLQLQGIADASATSFINRRGLADWDQVRSALDAAPACPRLRCHWSFGDCGYRKAAHACAEPDLLHSCCVPRFPARKGALAMAGVSLFLFMRDVCADDFVGWIDQRLADADPGPGAPDRAVAMGDSVLEPLQGVYGTGPKLWSMILADLLLAADPGRERWVTTGAGMIAVDSLIHNFLHRTGVLRRFRAEHPYGPRCYAPGGCAALIRGLARRIDARRFNPEFPADFPRFLESAIWQWCSASELDICNGNRVNDRARCDNHFCAVFDQCDRIPLFDTGPAGHVAT